MSEITKLATVLRDNGDQVLNGLSKLSLSASLLNNLNESFQHIVERRESISSTFQVVSNSHTKIEMFRDLQFLHDFVQRTVSLKIVTPKMATKPFTDQVDISKFINLKLLEMCKLKVCLVKGLQSLRGQLQYLICQQGLDTLQELLVNCGADESQGFVWSELKEANFSYNHLQSLDASFEYTPWIHTLNLSHNDLVDIGSLKCLHSLKHLNLSYNKIEKVPEFSAQLYSKLQVLILSNNYIENIDNLAPFVNLCELDLTNNWLMLFVGKDHQQPLRALRSLAALQWLKLDGNPFSNLCDEYRDIVCQHLHPNTISVRFVLDCTALSKKEKLLIGHVTHEPLKEGRAGSDRTRSNVSQCDSAVAVPQERVRKVRRAVIAEDGEHNNEMEESIASVSSLILPGEHLETKRQIEQLREEYGETWLKNEAGSLVQDALGFQKQQPLSKLSPYSSTPIESQIMNITLSSETVKNKNDAVSNDEHSNAYVTASNSTLSEDSVYAGEKVASGYASDDEQDDEDDDEAEEDMLGEGEENLYVVTVPDTNESVFVIVSNTHLWERDISSTKERTRWGLDILLSCELIKSDPPTVQLEFDTLRRDKQKRVYELDAEEADRFVQKLNSVLSVKPVNYKVFRCMKCSAQFTVETGRRYDVMKPETVLACAACGSTLVIEEDEDESGDTLKT